MKPYKVSELMIPLSDYPTVDENALFCDAVYAIEHAQERFNKRRLNVRAVIVLDRNRKVVGKIGYMDFLQGLEPTYGNIPEFSHLGANFTADFIKAQFRQHNLWQKPIDQICKKATRRKVKDFMHTPSADEYISVDDTLDEAVYHLIMTKRQSLLVRQGKDVVGILRLTDVVEKVFEFIHLCENVNQ